MYRYERNEPYLMHFGTKGMQWGKRLYQYKDGSLTPLGREHYGYKGKEDTRSPVDRRIAKVQAFFDTIDGKIRKDYLYGKPKTTKPASVSSGKDRAAKARAAKAEKKRIKEAEEMDRNAQEQHKKVEEERSKERVDKAKQSRWSEFTDEELEKYANRVNLEARATEAYLKKIDAPRQILEEITKYGKVGIDIYTQYKNITGMINQSKEEKVPDLSEKLARQTISDLVKEVNGGKKVTDLKSNDLETMIQVIGKINKIEGMAKKGSNSGGNNNNGGGNNNNGGGGKNNKKKGS